MALWMDLEVIMLSKISQTEKVKHCIILLVFGISKKKKEEKKRKKVRKKNRLIEKVISFVVIRGGGWRRGR